MPSRIAVHGHRSRTFLFPVALLIAVSVCVTVGPTPTAQAVAPPPEAHPAARIFLSYAPDHEQTAPSEDAVSVLSPFHFYVLAEGSVRISAWEARIVVPPEVVVKRRTLPGARNLDVSKIQDNWIVGLGACTDLAAEAPLVLAQYEAVLLSRAPGAAIAIVGTEPSSLPQAVPAWADCAGSRTRVQPFGGRRGVLSLDDSVAPQPTTKVGPSTLFGAAPNPFNPATSIRFRLASADGAKLKIYNLAGRLVRTFDLGSLTPGDNEVVWNGRDDAGRGVASAVYLVRLEAADQLDTMRILLLK